MSTLSFSLQSPLSSSSHDQPKHKGAWAPNGAHNRALLCSAGWGYRRGRRCDELAVVVWWFQATPGVYRRMLCPAVIWPASASQLGQVPALRGLLGRSFRPWAHPWGGAPTREPPACSDILPGISSLYAKLPASPPLLLSSSQMFHLATKQLYLIYLV